MPDLKEMTSCVVLGDVVGSRLSVDRAALHRDLAACLTQANERFGVDLRITVGDEYQGHFPSLGAALAATWWVRLHLLPEVDVRHGIALGATAVLDAESGIEDGPGWWAAREAIETVALEASRARTRSRRDRLEGHDGTSDALVRAVNAALVGRDELTARLDPTAVSVVRGLLSGRTQSDLAEEIGVSGSAVSQRVRQHGIGALLEIQAGLEEIA